MLYKKKEKGGQYNGKLYNTEQTNKLECQLPGTQNLF